ncbi:MAG: hypothetical protein HY043_21075 [Verrucomicrobia bacterium]|nr:hypothetical protein [Verrucomicrobiota bacterium]
MSSWIIIYLCLFGAISAGGVWDDYRNQRQAWVLGCAIVSNLTVAYLFVAFWQPTLRIPLSFVAPLAFAASMCWEMFQVFEDIRTLRADPKLNEMKQPAIAIFIAVALLVICLPAFIVAGISAFKA